MSPAASLSRAEADGPSASERPPPRREEGVVLLLVLIIVVTATVSVYALQKSATLDMISLQRNADRTRAEALARSGVEIAERALADDLFGATEEDLGSRFETRGDPWSALGRVEIPVELGNLRVEVFDSGSRFNLNALLDPSGQREQESTAFLTAALERVIENMPGRREDKPYVPEELAEAILDWIDEDDVTRLGDLEADYYANADSRPRDRPIVSLRELGGIPGVDSALLAEIEHYFTPYPLFPIRENGGVNPNTAPPHVLGLIYFGAADDKRLVTADDVFRILSAREEGLVFCGDESEERCVTFASEIGRVGETVFPPLRLASDVFTVRSRAQIGRGDGPSAEVTVLATLDREGLPEWLVLEYGVE